MRRILIFILLTIATTGVAFAADSQATGQFQFQPIVSIPLPGQGGSVNGCTKLGDYINAVFQLAIIVAIVLAVIMIIIDGFKYMTSEAVGNKKDALKGIQSALFGLLIILACTMVLKIINPQLITLSALSQNGGALSGCSTADSNAVNAPINNLNLGSVDTTQQNPNLDQPNLGQTPPIDLGAGTWCFQTNDGFRPGQQCFSSQSQCSDQQKSPASFATTQCSNSGTNIPPIDTSIPHCSCAGTQSATLAKSWCLVTGSQKSKSCGFDTCQQADTAGQGAGIAYSCTYENR